MINAMIILFSFLPRGVSWITVEVASIIENAESKPRLKRAIKKRIDQKLPPGIVAHADGKAMKASPNELTLSLTGESICLRYPMMANTVNPLKKLTNELPMEIMKLSMITGLSGLL